MIGLQILEFMIKSFYEGREYMKLRTIVDESAKEEITITCRERNNRITFLEDVIRNAIGRDSELLLTIGNTRYFVPKREILFFESLDGKVVAHTADNIYGTTYKLYELEQLLPSFFARASKSCIVNTDAIYSLRKNITGASEITFRTCHKKVYLSRSYYKPLMERINETRLQQ